MAQDTRYDAFGRLRVSEPLTIFDSKQIFDNEPSLWDESLESGAGITSAHSTDTASTVITSTISTAGVFTRQTFMRFNYQPGKSQLVVMTGIIAKSGGGTGVQRRVGIFDDDNGLFFEHANGAVSANCRSSVTGSPVDISVAQPLWNVDQMDGYGSSGILIDWSKAQIFSIDFEWLGVGTSRFSLVVDGISYLAHRFRNANNASAVYMSTPNLPLRYQMVTTSSSPVSVMEGICTTVISEGGISALGIPRVKSTEGTHIDADVEDTIYAIIGIRLKSAYIGETIHVLKAAIQILTQSEAGEMTLRFNPTVAGSPSWGNETDSAIQTFIGATANTVTGGRIIAHDFAESTSGGGGKGSSDSSVESELRLGAAIDGTVDEIILCWEPTGGTSGHDIEGAITWREAT